MNINHSVAIEKKFADHLIKSRRGSFGVELIYVGTPEYIRRLNEVFDYEWSWKILEVLRESDSVAVKCQLSGTIGNTVVVKETFGSVAIKRNKKTGEIINYGDDLKAASSDALKKACSLFGIGLHLWCEPEEEPHPSGPIDPAIMGHDARVARVVDAFSKYSITLFDLESSLEKPDRFWGEEEFGFLREQLAKAKLSKGSFQLDKIRS